MMSSVWGLAVPLLVFYWKVGVSVSSPGINGGFLLVRLTVASPKDLTEHVTREKLMHQLRRELHTHMPLVQVSLLSIRRS
ncbi:mucin-20 isoform X1 [Rattus norvegicus]|uniref:mucin-20 isoform X1 n=1 Tax=Rattus norvegicus TaxID=10116 RepID=UPI002FD7CCDE